MANLARAIAGKRMRGRAVRPVNIEAARQKRVENREKTYGLTDVGFAALLEHQGGVCAICGAVPEDPDFDLHVDHCHATGVVRGLLCMPCNTAIGMLQDDHERMRRAADYVERHRPPNPAAA